MKKDQWQWAFFFSLCDVLSKCKRELYHFSYIKSNVCVGFMFFFYQIMLPSTNKHTSNTHTHQVTTHIMPITLWTDVNPTLMFGVVNVLHHILNKLPPGGWTWRQSTASITSQSILVWITFQVSHSRYVSCKKSQWMQLRS